MIATVPGVTGHGRPSLRCWVPHFRIEDLTRRLIPPGHTAAAYNQDLAIGQESGVELSPLNGHRSRGPPRGRSGIQVNELGSCSGRIMAADDYHFAVVVHHRRSFVTVAEIAKCNVRPPSLPYSVQVLRLGGGTSAKHLAVRC